MGRGQEEKLKMASLLVKSLENSQHFFRSWLLFPSKISLISWANFRFTLLETLHMIILLQPCVHGRPQTINKCIVNASDLLLWRGGWYIRDAKLKTILQEKEMIILVKNRLFFVFFWNTKRWFFSFLCGYLCMMLILLETYSWEHGSTLLALPE